MADLRAELIEALEAEALDLGCAGLPELDRIGDVLGRIAKRIAAPACSGCAQTDAGLVCRADLGGTCVR